MRIDSTKCDPSLFADMLAADASSPDQEALAEHLDRCPDCRTKLESLAAGASWWRAAGEFLADAEHDLDNLDAAATDTDENPAHDVSAVLAALAPSDDPRMLGRLGGYEVSGVVGSGGMGVVLKALDPALDRYVAIKVLSPHLAGSGAARRRFAREAKAAAAVVHDNVIEIYGVAEFDGLPFLVMPYIRGASLQQRLDREGSLALQEVLRIGLQTAAGLAAAHSLGLVHRDIKPANILLPDGVERVQITDFGLARAADDASLTRTGMIAGTPQFMSPEQARGERVDQRSDLFSLGSVMYTMCTGRRPFRADSSYGTLRRITDYEPRPIREINPAVPTWLCTVIAQLHAKQPERRPPTAGEVAELLSQCLAHVEQPDSHHLPMCLDRSRRPRAAKLRNVAAVLSIAACIVLAAIFPVENLNRPRRDAAPHQQPDAESRLKQEADSATARSTTAREQSPNSDDAELNWNSDNDELRDIDRGTQELEERSGRFFDSSPRHTARRPEE